MVTPRNRVKILKSRKIRFFLAYANDNFKVASCNDASGRPELTIQIADSYYTNNLSGQEGFALADGYYSKAIAEDDLDFTFSDDADGMSTKLTMKFENEIRHMNFFRNYFELHLGHWFISD